jgi:hypothetical protein
MVIEQRQQEQLARATTDVQREKMRELFALNKDVYPESRQGKSVIAAFARYCKTFDSEKIDQGLYHFSIMGAGGLDDIAHYNIHGFRGVYPHPANYIEGLLIPSVERWPEARRIDPNDYHSLDVYTDGMTAGEVAHAIIDIAAEQKARVYADWKQKHDTAALETATRLAADLGMKLVPA